MSGSRGAGPSPDGRHDDLLPEDLDGLTLHAPDDPRDLEADRRCLAHRGGDRPSIAPASGTWTQRREARRRRLARDRRCAGGLLAGRADLRRRRRVDRRSAGVSTTGRPSGQQPPLTPVRSAACSPTDAILQDGATPISAAVAAPVGDRPGPGAVRRVRGAALQRWHARRGRSVSRRWPSGRRTSPTSWPPSARRSVPLQTVHADRPCDHPPRHLRPHRCHPAPGPR